LETLPTSAEVHLCAGGTDLLPKMKRHDETGAQLVSLGQVAELRGIRDDGAGRLTIGAMTTLAAVARDEQVLRHFRAVAEAARVVASPQIRNRATVGGNLLVDNRCTYYDQSALNRDAHGRCYKDEGDVCHMVKGAGENGAPLCRARFVSDLAPVLILHDARLHLLGPGGERTLPLRDFYLGDGIRRNRLAPREVLRAVSLETPPTWRVLYTKLRIRQAIDFPSVGVAVGVRDGGKGARAVAITGIEPQPTYLAFTDESLEVIAEAAMAAVSPLNQDFLPPAYRRKMVGVLVRRLGTALGATPADGQRRPG
jgi:4-hydroxybenzoyl-CoA reductase subunit beta